MADSEYRPDRTLIDDIPDEEYQGKVVVCRVDYNVPMDGASIRDDTRISSTIPTLKYLLDRNVKAIVLLSHMGRPAGKVVPEYSLAPIAAHLGELMCLPVAFVDDCGDATKVRAAIDGAGGLIMLENVRFYAQEESKSVASPEVVEFRRLLTSYGDIFVNDAFAACHRAHSSLVGVTAPKKAAGFLLKKELVYFGKALESPARPFLAILGGKKVDTKISLIMNLLDRVDEVIICGGMAFTFQKVLNSVEIGRSIFDEDGAGIVPAIMAKAEAKGVKMHIASDWMCADDFSETANTKVRTADEGIEDGWEGLDAGPASLALWCDEVIPRCQTILWNGPPGVFEMAPFRVGSLRMVEAMVGATKNSSAVSIICGGDTAVLANKFSSPANFSHVSTGGGASLELCEGKVLPGVANLTPFQASE